MSREVDYVLNGGTLDTIAVARLVFPRESDEARRCGEVVNILKDYADREDGPKTLSIAVFGPPGSGKSRTVEEIAKAEELENKYADLQVVNLSQLSGVEGMIGLMRVLLPAIPSKSSESTESSESAKLIPIIFFDEFDTPLKGKALGWLRWFLALMQDGKYLDGEKSVKFGKAVFLFAGGTASSFSEFEERAKLDEVAYREKKVPDFISRLRSFIDVKGINEKDEKERRDVRRALLLRFHLLKRWEKKEEVKKEEVKKEEVKKEEVKKEEVKKEEVKFDIDRKRLNSLLSTAHLIHGARSMEALVEMCTREAQNKIHIPNGGLTKLHVGRGALDGKLVGISAGLGGDKSEGLLEQITSSLLREGAKLAYGGDFEPDGTLGKIVAAAGDTPADFFDQDDKRIRNYLGSLNSWRKEVKDAKAIHCDEVEFKDLTTLFDQEIRDLNLTKGEWFKARPTEVDETYQSNHHLAWAINLFRLRVRLIQDIDALIVFGGKDGESWGRFSGIAEEVMLAFAFRKPVYILGGAGGAASEVGKLLGLDHTVANPDECLEDEKPIKDICPPKFGRAFAIANLDLPQTIEELRNYLFSHSITTEGKWPWNGLQPMENQELFRTAIHFPDAADDGKRRANIDVIVGTIVKGLSRLEWKKPASQHS